MVASALLRGGGGGVRRGFEGLEPLPFFPVYVCVCVCVWEGGGWEGLSTEDPEQGGSDKV